MNLYNYTFDEPGLIATLKALEHEILELRILKVALPYDNELTRQVIDRLTETEQVRYELTKIHGGQSKHTP